MNRRVIPLALSVTMLCGFGLANDLSAADEEEASASDVKTKVELVRADADAKSITVKKLTTEAAEPETLTVEGKALASLNDFKTGDRVTLTCKEGSGSEGGTPCVVTEMAKAPDKE